MTTTSRIERVIGRALPLRGNDIDTDRIMPARFLKAITFEGLEQRLFEDDRRAVAAAGGTHPFDVPAYHGARVLLANANFGCGSSREHAPQAIARWGIGAVVAESFAEIFFANALALGLVCVTAPAADINRLMTLVELTPRVELVVDLQEAQVRAGDVRAAATMPESARAAWLSGGWDATGLLLERYDEVERTEMRLPLLARGRA